MDSTVKWRGQKKKISELEDRAILVTQSEQQRENRLKNKMSSKDMQDYMKRSNAYVIRDPEEQKRVWG